MTASAKVDRLDRLLGQIDQVLVGKLHLNTPVELNDGTTIPVVGLGTYVPQRTKDHYAKGFGTPVDDAKEDKLLTDAVTVALQNGYTHLDSAQAYDTERLLMQGIKAAQKERKDVYITSKLSSSIRDPQEAKKVIMKSIEYLGGYIDLMLVHSPNTQNEGKDVIQCYQVMMDLKKQGLLKSIGVSNFNVSHLECFEKKGLDRPSVNQIEIHPFLVESKVVEYCEKQNIKIQAYSPIAQAKKLDTETLVAIAKKYNKSAAQVMLRWGLQMGFIILPKSATPKRIISNADLFDFELSKEDMNALDKLKDEYFRCCWNVINTVEWNEKLFE